MAEPYEEILEGETHLRHAPGPRHEKICGFLHQQVSAILATNSTSRLLPPRSVVQLSPGTLIRPDLALVTAANNRLWLAAEIIDSDDHRIDTVLKKTIYEDTSLPRLWMIDPRYDNIEVYQGGAYGLALQHILATKEILTETLLPGLSIAVARLFNGA
ncbi:MAG: Uma2 family endonuclease [Verrucomicrobiota bacterium]